jgi:hypothetical protein
MGDSIAPYSLTSEGRPMTGSEYTQSLEDVAGEVGSVPLISINVRNFSEVCRQVAAMFRISSAGLIGYLPRSWALI